MKRVMAYEGRKFLYAPWMPVSLALVLDFLVFFFWKMHVQQAEPQIILLFLLSERKYHALLYAILAFYIFGLDAGCRIMDAEQMAGHSTSGIVLRKSVLYFLLVCILNVIYSAVCIVVCGIELRFLNAAFLRAMLFRYVLDMGNSSVFVVAQVFFCSLQPTLIVNGLLTVGYMAVYRDYIEQWYEILARGGVISWAKAAAAVGSLIVFPLLAIAVRSFWKRR